MVATAPFQCGWDGVTKGESYMVGAGEGEKLPPNGDAPKAQCMEQLRKRTMHGCPPGIAVTAPVPWGGGV